MVLSFSREKLITRRYLLLNGRSSSESLPALFLLTKKLGETQVTFSFVILVIIFASSASRSMLSKPALSFSGTG